MNGIHDLGGITGLGPVTIEADEPLFHAEWERRVFGVITTYFVSGLCPPDEFRHSIERMDGIEYLTSSYYDHWLHAAETIALEHGLVTKDELEARYREIALARAER